MYSLHPCNNDTYINSKNEGEMSFISKLYKSLIFETVKKNTILSHEDIVINDIYTCILYSLMHPDKLNRTICFAICVCIENIRLIKMGFQHLHPYIKRNSI